MSASLHLLCNSVSGHGSSDGGNHLCLGVYGKQMGMVACPSVVSLKCSSRRMPFLCRSSSNSQRRNPRQNRQGFSPNRNRHNEDRDGSDHLDDPDYLASKNGPLLSFTNTNKLQTTAGPGPREREIVELFRKVQAQLRERAAAKEERKFEVSKGQDKGSETVDSLLKLLRKHSVEQGKRKVNGGSASEVELNLNQTEQVGTFDEEKGESLFNLSSSTKDQLQEDNAPSFSRPTSKFQRRSPVPRVRYEPVISNEETAHSVSPFIPARKSRNIEPEDGSEFEPETEREPEFGGEGDHETEVESSFADEDVGSGILEVADEALDSEEVSDDEDDEGETKLVTEVKDLDAMKLQDLRALAKARGVRRYSKLKKADLIGLLSEDAL